MKKIVMTMVLCGLAMVSCRSDKWDEAVPAGVRVRLTPEAFSNEPETRSAITGYDRTEFCVADRDGNVMGDVKGIYSKDGSVMELEGLHEGEYTLYIIAVVGDEDLDGAVIHEIQDVSEEWISFPEDLRRPLEAEYFYSSTDFTVTRSAGPDGYTETADLPSSIVQKRIVSRLDIAAEFSNPDIANAVVSNVAVLTDAVFSTGMSAAGEYTGRSAGGTGEIDLAEGSQLLFMPLADDGTATGNVRMKTTRYSGGEAECDYSFSGTRLVPNTVTTITVRAEHPDNENGTRYITEKTYGESEHSKILQDDEHHSVYTDNTQRQFNTSAPLQLSITSGGRLHVRFYSPKDLHGVTVKGYLPAASDEYFDLAYFDRIPAFADFWCELPITQKEAMYRTESGKYVKIPAFDASSLTGMKLKADSEDPYWKKLEKIEHGWRISFSLYGGDPERPDGGPVSNWMGIRPVHCREAVALFINFTYMIDMPEHEQILRDNESILYGNGGVNDKVTADQVLAQMRQARTLIVGLVYPGNGVVGLGGGTAFGAYQSAWLTHYTNTYSCEIMFHELGHVMGYNHSSSFTYGPWAQQLMNNFYVNNIKDLPIDSETYLNSKSNENLYK